MAVRSANTHGIGADPIGVLREAQRMQKQDPESYDSTWLLVDVDAHVRLPRCLKEAAAAGIRVSVSNPCFEIWLLWHFENMSAHQSSDWLRRRLRTYGLEGKSIGAAFPFGQHSMAVTRAQDKGQTASLGVIGPNPSSALPHLVEALQTQR